MVFSGFCVIAGMWEEALLSTVPPPIPRPQMKPMAWVGSDGVCLTCQIIDININDQRRCLLKAFSETLDIVDVTSHTQEQPF